MTNPTDEDEDRRKFLVSCGKFAAVTPPAMTVLLSTSLTSTAIAHSGGQSAGWYGRDNGRKHSFFDNDPEDATETASSGGRSAGEHWDDPGHSNRSDNGDANSRGSSGGQNSGDEPAHGHHSSVEGDSRLMAQPGGQGLGDNRGGRGKDDNKRRNGK
jgi:hypothetical protein